MVRKVYKWDVPVKDHFTVAMPKGTEILKVESQGDSLVNNPSVVQMWGLCVPDAPFEMRSFRLSGTGHPIEEMNLKHISTFQVAGGHLVWHVFEILE